MTSLPLLLTKEEKESGWHLLFHAGERVYGVKLGGEGLPPVKTFKPSKVVIKCNDNTRKCPML